MGDFIFHVCEIKLLLNYSLVICYCNDVYVHKPLMIEIKYHCV